MKRKGKEMKGKGNGIKRKGKEMKGKGKEITKPKNMFFGATKITSFRVS